MFLTGQKVMCIDDEFPQWVLGLYQQLPRKDGTYTIREVMLGGTNPNFSKKEDGKIHTSELEEDITVLLVEAKNPLDPFCKYPIELSFKAERFVPLEELTEEEIMSITSSRKVSLPQPVTPQPQELTCI